VRLALGSTLRGAAAYLALAVQAVGLALRIEHAWTFSNVEHGADYDRHMTGVGWMMHHWRPFDFTPDISWTISYQGPLWYMLGAAVKSLCHANRPLAAIAVVGWVVRQYFLGLLLKQVAPIQPWLRLVVLTLGAFLPIGMEADGTINPEALHTSIVAVAAYWLWRMEQDARRSGGIGMASAATFGVVAGLGVLTKATSGLLPMSAVLLVAWQNDLRSQARRRMARLLEAAAPSERCRWRGLVRSGGLVARPQLAEIRAPVPARLGPASTG
jgi:hypothetical protein